MKKHRIIYFIVAFVLAVTVVFLPLIRDNNKEVKADTSTVFHYQGFNLPQTHCGCTLSWNNQSNKYRFVQDGSLSYYTTPFGFLGFDLSFVSGYYNFKLKMGSKFNALFRTYYGTYGIDVSESSVSRTFDYDYISVPNSVGNNFYYFYLVPTPYSYLPYTGDCMPLCLETFGSFNGSVSILTFQLVQANSSLSENFPFSNYYKFTFYDSENSYFCFYYPSGNYSSSYNLSYLTDLTTYYFNQDADSSAVSYNQGYQDGYASGSSVIQSVSYDRGYEVGVADGYQQGVNAELGELTPFGVIKLGITEFLGIGLFGNVTIGTLISLIFGIIMLLLLLKVVS